ncbi:MAG: aldo/keto reductase [Alphaproteobacteria bacterium]|nr:aldo/keto reductase [Alphaproteobacteria bacterium]
METRKLGRTGLDVSLLTFGCGAVGGLMPKGAPADQREAVTRALDLGINFFDTAPLYGNGTSETNLGRILAELKPDIVLGSKVRIAPEQKTDMQAAVAKSVEESLRRLRRDHIDILQLHNPVTEAGSDWDLTPDQVLEQAAPALERARQEGKARFIGMTAIGETPALQKVIDSGPFDTGQIVFNMLNPSAGETVAPDYPAQDYEGLLSRSCGKGLGSIVIRSLAGGALSGSEERHPLGMPVVAPIGSGPDYGTDAGRARRFSPLVEEAGCRDLVELAIRYVASHQDVSTLQVGIATVDQFLGAAEAVNKGPLSADLLERIREIQSSFANDGAES